MSFNVKSFYIPKFSNIMQHSYRSQKHLHFAYILHTHNLVWCALCTRMTATVGGPANTAVANTQPFAGGKYCGQYNTLYVGYGIRGTYFQLLACGSHA